MPIMFPNKKNAQASWGATPDPQNNPVDPSAIAREKTNNKIQELTQSTLSHSSVLSNSPALQEEGEGQQDLMASGGSKKNIEEQPTASSTATDPEAEIKSLLGKTKNFLEEAKANPNSPKGEKAVKDFVEHALKVVEAINKNPIRDEMEIFYLKKELFEQLLPAFQGPYSELGIGKKIIEEIKENSKEISKNKNVRDLIMTIMKVERTRSTHRIVVVRAMEKNEPGLLKDYIKDSLGELEDSDPEAAFSLETIFTTIEDYSLFEDVLDELVKRRASYPMGMCYMRVLRKFADKRPESLEAYRHEFSKDIERAEAAQKERTRQIKIDYMEDLGNRELIQIGIDAEYIIRKLDTFKAFKACKVEKIIEKTALAFSNPSDVLEEDINGFVNLAISAYGLGDSQTIDILKNIAKADKNHFTQEHVSGLVKCLIKGTAFGFPPDEKFAQILVELAKKHNGLFSQEDRSKVESLCTKVPRNSVLAEIVKGWNSKYSAPYVYY